MLTEWRGIEIKKAFQTAQQKDAEEAGRTMTSPKLYFGRTLLRRHLIPLLPLKPTCQRVRAEARLSTSTKLLRSQEHSELRTRARNKIARRAQRRERAHDNQYCASTGTSTTTTTTTSTTTTTTTPATITNRDRTRRHAQTQTPTQTQTQPQTQKQMRGQTQTGNTDTDNGTSTDTDTDTGTDRDTDPDTQRHRTLRQRHRQRHRHRHRQAQTQTQTQPKLASDNSR